MNIQIFGTKKCNDTKKAERFFKERGIKYQFIDMKEKGMSKGEFNSVTQVNGGLENMMILSILVDTFISKISFPMQPGPEIGSISDA